MTDLIAPMREVTVYADRALIVRGGSVELEAGEQELCVNNLPPFLRESLRASGHGPEGARILDVDIRTTFHARPPEAELVTLQTACDLLQQRLDLLEARQDALRDRREWLRALGEQSREFAKGLASGQMKARDCAEFFTFTSDEALHNAEAEQDLALQSRQLQEELNAKKRELASKQGNSQPDRWTAVVVLEMPARGEFTLSLSYLVTQASWQPQYDARVTLEEDGNRGEVELTYTGMVQQSTGEDWSQVQLALSTARPSQAAVLPELQPRYLNVYSPPIHMPVMAAAPALPGGVFLHSQTASRGFGAKQKRVSEEIEMEMDQASFDMPPEPMIQASVVTATTEQSGTAYVFKIARSVDIPSDNSPHKTTIARDHLPCEFDYVSAPSLEAAVHLRARITNTTERVLLPGSSSIFLSGDYVGTTQVAMTSPREQFKIFLGIDDTLKVKREQIERTVEKGALLQGDLRRIIYAYRITIHNYAAFPRNMVLRDQLPVPQHERLKVKTQSIQPQPTERTKLEILTWRFNLAANGEYKIEYRYAVEHPQDIQVTGLP